ncbi:MAG: hypothetical protein AB4062_00060 [Crocosphaera sp.]
MITELWINLKGEIDDNTLIEDLIKDSPTTSLGSCKGEIVQPQLMKHKLS